MRSRRPRPGAVGFVPNTQPLEMRTLLSLGLLGAEPVGRPPLEGMSALVESTRSSAFHVTNQPARTGHLGPNPHMDLNAPMTSTTPQAAADLATAATTDDETSGYADANDQVEVPPDDEADDTSSIVEVNGQVEVQL